MASSCHASRVASAEAWVRAQIAGVARSQLVGAAQLRIGWQLTIALPPPPTTADSLPADTLPAAQATTRHTTFGTCAA